MAEDIELTPELDTVQNLPKGWLKNFVLALLLRGLNFLPKGGQLAGKAGRPLAIDPTEGGPTVDVPVDLGRQTLRGYLAARADDVTDQTLTIDSTNAGLYTGTVTAFDRATAQGLIVSATAGDGFCMGIYVKGAGQLTVTASGLTIRNRAGHTKSAGRYARLQVEIIGTDLVLCGDTAA